MTLPIQQLLGAPAAPSTLTPARGVPWRDGAVLQALVLEVSAPGQVQLQIGNQTISARSIFPLAEGQVLSLRVTHTGEFIVLSAEAGATPGAARPAPAVASAAATEDAALAQQALREALPRQAPLPPLLANLSFVARTPERFPPALVALVAAVLQSVPDAHTLADPDALAERVARAGPWLEAALASIPADPTAPARVAQDWKGVLLRFAASLRTLAEPARTVPGGMSPPPEQGEEAGAGLLRTALPPDPRAAMPAPAGASDEQPAVPVAPAATRPAMASPAPEAPPLLRTSATQPQPRVAATLAELVGVAPEARVAAQLLDQVEGALARVELGQLSSLPAEDASAPSWWVELPVRAPDGGLDVLQLRIERERPGTNEGEREQAAWAVSLAFDLGDLGPVRARIAVRGDRVSTLFFAERPGTMRRVRAELGALETALSQHGLRVGDLACRAGMPQPPPTPPAPTRLLEVDA